MFDNPFRVLLDLTELNIEGFKYVWINVSPRELKTIGDFKSSLYTKLNFENRDIKLFVRDGLLLEDEKIIILREDDTIKVEYGDKYFTVLNETNGWEREKLEKSVLKKPDSVEEPVVDISTHKKKKHRKDKESYLWANTSQPSPEIQTDKHITDHSESKSKKCKKKDHLPHKDVSKLNSEINSYQNINGSPDAESKKYRRDDDLDNSVTNLNLEMSSSYKITKQKRSHNKAIVQENLVSPLIKLESPTKNNYSKEILILEDFQKVSSDIKNIDTDDLLHSVSHTIQSESGETLPNDKTSGTKRKRKRKRNKKRKNTSDFLGMSVLENSSVDPSSMPENFTEINNSLGIGKHIRYTSPSPDHNLCKVNAVSSESVITDNKLEISNGMAVTLTKENFQKSIVSSVDVSNISPKVFTPSLLNQMNYGHCDMTPTSNAVSTEEANVHKENKNGKRVLQNVAVEGKDKYAKCPVLESMPAVGTHIAYKILELNSNYSPEVSDYKEGIIKNIDADTDEIEIELLKEEVKPGRTGKFENLREDEVPSPEIIKQVILSWPTLIEPRLVIK